MNLISITKLKCPQCSAPVSSDESQCQYCGTEFLIQSKEIKLSFFKKQKNTKEFGRNTFILNFIGIVVIHAIAWFLTGDNYWDDSPFYIWFGILPLWVTVMIASWFKKQLAIIIGFFISVLVFVANMIFIYLKENGRFNDDFLIVAGFISIAFFVSWIIGRVFHALIRYYINNAESINKKFKE